MRFSPAKAPSRSRRRSHVRADLRSAAAAAGIVIRQPILRPDDDGRPAPHPVHRPAPDLDRRRSPTSE